MPFLFFKLLRCASYSALPRSFFGLYWFFVGERGQKLPGIQILTTRCIILLGWDDWDLLVFLFSVLWVIWSSLLASTPDGSCLIRWSRALSIYPVSKSSLSGFVAANLTRSLKCNCFKHVMMVCQILHLEDSYPHCIRRTCVPRHSAHTPRNC